MTSPLFRRIGWGAGLLLVLLIAFAVTPSLIVRHEIETFARGLRRGMTADSVAALASRSGLRIDHATGSEVAYVAPAPWGVPTKCATNYLMIVGLREGRVTYWIRYVERVCAGGS
jgi:hypothetical protein